MVPDRHLRYGGVGGYGNHAHGIGATVSGGIPNRATDDYATVPGGSGNIAESEYSFAAGRMAHAKYRGCFVWGDSTDDTVACNDTDEFVARASGGFYFYTSADLSTGVKLVPGASYWDNLSDRARKRDIEPVDPDHVLARLAELPIYTWRYASQPNGGRHLGPMAQDFHAAFGLGTDDRSIGSLDADGVALAALQARGSGTAHDRPCRAGYPTSSTTGTAVTRSASSNFRDPG
jgi:hypothetical protein